MQQGNVFDYYKLPEVLSKEETISYFKNKDEKAREILITHNIRLVLNYVLKLNTNYDKNELIEIALFGLIKAVDNYDYKKGISFSTFAISCIRNEILMLKLQRIGIRMQRKENLKMLFDSVGKVPEFTPIPDYIDHRFARLRGLIDRENQKTSVNNNENLKRAISMRKMSKRKSSKNIMRKKNKRNTK